MVIFGGMTETSGLAVELLTADLDCASLRASFRAIISIAYFPRFRCVIANSPPGLPGLPHSHPSSPECCPGQTFGFGTRHPASSGTKSSRTDTYSGQPCMDTGSLARRELRLP